MIRYVLVFLLLVVTSVAWTQEEEDVIFEYRKGKKYIVHFVQSGNTLWGIHNTYNVTVEDIVASNPGIERGVTEGQKVLVPKGAADGKYPDGTVFKMHKVVKGETLYRIAAVNGATVEEVTKVNPGLENGMKLGQILRIPMRDAAQETTEVPEPVKAPVAKVIFYDTLVKHTVLPHETLFSISKRFMVPVNDLQTLNKLRNGKIKEGDIIQIPLKKEKVKPIEVRKVLDAEASQKLDKELLFSKKEEYKIAIMLPFNLDKADDNANALRSIATEYYMGVELAVDSLQLLGLRAKVYVYDLPMDSVGIYAILQKPEMRKMDLIFGPLIPQSADLVGRWCKNNKIRMVCPAACNSALMLSNPYIYAAVPTDITQQRILANYTVANHATDQLVLVSTGVAKDKELYDAFRAKFMEASKGKANVKLIEIKSEEAATYIRKNGNTIFIVPSRDRIASVKFINNMHKFNERAGNGTISVFGTKDWGGFEEIIGYMKNKYNVSWVSSSDLNYNLPATKNLLRKFRYKYKSDLTRYSAHGFDVMFYFTNSLLMQQKPELGIVNAFDMKQVGKGNGYENGQCFLLKHENYELVRVGLAHE